MTVTTMNVAAMMIRLFLSVILLRAALHKQRNRLSFQAELKAYQLLPDSLVSIAAIALLITEAFTSLMLLNPDWNFPALIAAVLFGVYALAMLVNLLKGRNTIDCGCSGPLFSNKEMAKKTISGSLVIRNLLLMSLALFCTTSVNRGESGALEIFIVLAGAFAGLFLYESIEQAIANAQGYQRWKTRNAESTH